MRFNSVATLHTLSRSTVYICIQTESLESLCEWYVLIRTAQLIKIAQPKVSSESPALSLEDRSGRNHDR